MGTAPRPGREGFFQWLGRGRGEGVEMVGTNLAPCREEGAHERRPGEAGWFSGKLSSMSGLCLGE